MSSVLGGWLQQTSSESHLCFTEVILENNKKKYTTFTDFVYVWRHAPGTGQQTLINLRMWIVNHRKTFYFGRKTDETD